MDQRARTRFRRLGEQRRVSKQFSARAKISLLTPVHNTSAEFLERCSPRSRPRPTTIGKCAWWTAVGPGGNDRHARRWEEREPRIRIQRLPEILESRRTQTAPCRRPRAIWWLVSIMTICWRPLRSMRWRAPRRNFPRPTSSIAMKIDGAWKENGTRRFSSRNGALSFFARRCILVI